MLNYRHWIDRFPDQQKAAVEAAMESASLGKARHALRLLEKLDEEQRGGAFDVELLSTYNLEPILPILQLAISCLPSRAHLHLAPLDNIEGYISQPATATTGGRHDARLILWRLEELLPEALYPLSHGFPERLAIRLDQVLARVDRVVSLHQRNASGIPLLLSTIPLPVHFSNPVFAAQHSVGMFGSIARINQKIYDVASHNDGVHVLDIASWAAFQGKAQADATLEFLARQPLSPKAQVEFALFLARSLRLLITPRRKVLALDLDNTLWGGVVGEDGLDNLKLGHEFPGNIHLRIQRELVELRHRGVLLVLLSKNNEPDVREAFTALPDMVLKWDDFAVRKIDWNHKHENLRAAAKELGLGLDSFVFLDDSDYEREQIRQLMPEVLILNESPDPLHILRSLWETDVFDSLSVSQEDRQRHHDYAVRQARDVKAHESDLEEFLKSLEMTATIEAVGSHNLERVVSLLGKTNQFNVTTRRHSRAQVQAMLECPGFVGLALRLRDKFGDQGIVAVLLAVASKDPAVLIVDSFLVSCRALGRGVEDALWAAMLRRVDRQRVRRLEAEYVPTAKNSIVSDLYDRLGLQRIEHNPSLTRYLMEPVITTENPSWILSENGTHER
jgi:FkbH-like protein